MWRGRRALQGPGAATTGTGAGGKAAGMAVPGPSFPQRSGWLAASGLGDAPRGRRNWMPAATKLGGWWPWEVSTGGQGAQGTCCAWGSAAGSRRVAQSWCQSWAHLGQQLGNRDELLAVWAGAAGAQEPAEQVAVRAATHIQVALLALGTLVDPGPPRRQAGDWSEGRQRGGVAAPVGPRPARSGAEPGPGGQYLGVADRAAAASWAFWSVTGAVTDGDGAGWGHGWPLPGRWRVR